MTGKITVLASTPDALPAPPFPEATLLGAWPFRGSSAGVIRARDLIRGALTALGLPEPAVDDGVLMISELVTNALRYAHGPYELRLNRTEDAILCEVVDASPAIPAFPAPSGQSRACRTLAEIDATDDDTCLEMGRGLEVVWRLSGGHCGAVVTTTTYSPGSAKSVWFALPL